MREQIGFVFLALMGGLALSGIDPRPDRSEPGPAAVEPSDDFASGAVPQAAEKNAGSERSALSSEAPDLRPEAGAAALSAAVRAVKDPVSGRFLTEEPGGEPAGPVPFEESAVELTEAAGTTEAGGFRVNLRGRFRTGLVARKDGSGRISFQEVQLGAEGPARGGKKNQPESPPGA